VLIADVIVRVIRKIEYFFPENTLAKSLLVFTESTQAGFRLCDAPVADPVWGRGRPVSYHAGGELLWA
jgi:hypothetical protein